MDQKIPKIIHYCWFGGAPLPELAVKCIESWKKYCPDYEIRRWDESNFDLNCCRYVQEAYAAKKWAFVSDVARFRILYEYGGIYLDTDVEIIRPLDGILAQGGFMASESNCCDVATGLGIAAPPQLPLYSEIISQYERSGFFQENNAENLTTVVKRVTQILEGHGLEHKNTVQRIAGIIIYPKDFFCPKDLNTGKIEITPNTYAIHHYDASWWSEEQKAYWKLVTRFSKYFSVNVAKRMAKVATIAHSKGVWQLVLECRRVLKKKEN